MRSQWFAGLCLLLMGALFLVPHAEAEERSMEFPGEGFSIELPQKWAKVPEDVFREKMRPLKKALEKSDSNQKLGYDYAVQLESKEWFEYPYMLISHWEDIRVDSDEMSEMNERIEEGILKGGRGVNGTELVSSSFDADRNLYRAEARFSVSGQDMVLLKGVYYLNQSVLQLSSYVPEEMYSRYAPELKEAMQDLRIDASSVHRASEDSWLDFKDVVPYLKVLIATVVVFVVAGIYVLYRRRGGTGS